MSSCDKRLLIQFAKWPELGQVKTRMQPYLNVEQSKTLHRNLLKYTFNNLHCPKRWQQRLSLGGQACPDPERERPAIRAELEFNHLDDCVLQGEGDLGARMQDAAATALAQGFTVVIIGSDCPFMDLSYVDQAFTAIETGHDVVLGPAEDGGYVLVGLAENCGAAVLSALFEAMPWSQSHLYDETVAQLRQRRINYAALPRLSDIDRPEDLQLLQGIDSVERWY